GALRVARGLLRPRGPPARESPRAGVPDQGGRLRLARPDARPSARDRRRRARERPAQAAGSRGGPGLVLRPPAGANRGARRPSGRGGARVGAGPAPRIRKGGPRVLRLGPSARPLPRRRRVARAHDDGRARDQGARRARTRSPRSAGSAPRTRGASRCSSTFFSRRRRLWSAATASTSTRARSSARRSSRSWAPARSRWSMPDALDFEAPLLELENRIATLQAEEDSPRVRDEVAKLEERLLRQRQKTYASLTAWQRT